MKLAIGSLFSSKNELQKQRFNPPGINYQVDLIVDVEKWHVWFIFFLEVIIIELFLSFEKTNFWLVSVEVFCRRGQGRPKKLCI